MNIRQLAPIGFLAMGVAAGVPPTHAQGALEDVIVAVPNFTLTLTPTLVAEELGLWEKHGLRFKKLKSYEGLFTDEFVK